MHYFELRNFHHFILYLLPALIGIIVLAVALGRTHFRSDDSDARMHQVHTTYPGGIEEREAPFPLVLIFILAGTVLWAFAYIIFYGVLEVAI